MVLALLRRNRDVQLLLVTWFCPAVPILRGSMVTNGAGSVGLQPTKKRTVFNARPEGALGSKPTGSK